MPRHGISATGTEREAPARRPRGGFIGRWPIRRKLVLLVVLPMVIMIAGGSVIALQSFREYQRTTKIRELVDVSVNATRLSTALGLEFSIRQSSVLGEMSNPLESNPPGLKFKTLDEAVKNTDEQARQLDAAIEGVGTDQLSSELSDHIWNYHRSIGDLPAYRQALTPTSKYQGDAVYTEVINGINAAQGYLRNMIRSANSATVGFKPDLTTQVSQDTVYSLTSASQYASEERSIMAKALIDAEISQTYYSEMTTAASQSQVEIRQVADSGTESQQEQLSQLSDTDSIVTQYRQDLVSLLSTPDRPLPQDSASVKMRKDISKNIGGYNRTVNERIMILYGVVETANVGLLDHTEKVQSQALWESSVVAGAMIAVIVLVALVVASIARTITIPLRRLRAGAIDLTRVRLPQAVRTIETEGPEAIVPLPTALPEGVSAGPETHEVASAVDGLGAEAIRLATAQVRLRHALDEAFTSMSRRSQTMVEKQLAIIDELESSEEDPEQLRNLFRLDHLAARMRRYNDNLLVLAGSSVRTRSAAPVPVADVFRAATSEMEQYERVRLQPVSGASISGPAAGGLIHLLAELLDNAAMYSPPTSPIMLTSAFTPDGGMQIEVGDAGVGIPPTELAELNARLKTPGVIDMQVPSRMGLFVVARLAQRGGFQVQLSPRDGGPGTVAEVIVPAPHVVGAPGNTGDTPRMSAVQADRPAPMQADAPQPIQPPAPPAPPVAPVPPAPEPPRAAPRPPSRPATDDKPGVLPSRTPGAALSSGPLAGAGAAGSGAAPGAGPGAPAGPGQPPAGPFGQAWPSPFEPAGGRPQSQPRRETPGGTRQPATIRPAGVSSPPPTASQALEQGSGRQGRPGDAAQPQKPAGQPHGSQESGAPAGQPQQPQNPAGAPQAPFTPQSPAGGQPPKAPPGLQQLFGSMREATTSDTGSLPTRQLKSGSGRSRQPGAPGGQGSGQGPATPSRPTAGAPIPWAHPQPPAEPAAPPARPQGPEASMPGAVPELSASDGPTPIFDSISMWFNDAAVAEPKPPVVEKKERQEVDVRSEPEQGAPVTGRWANLGDQRWLATNARAAAAPDVAGNTTSGLPRRRPGANLLPSAATAAAAAPPAPASPVALPAVDAEVVRGRLGDYQRGLASARRSRQATGNDNSAGGLFTAARGGDNTSGQKPGKQGGDQ